MINLETGLMTQMERADPPDYPTKLVWPDDPEGSGWSKNPDRLGRPDDPDKPDDPYLSVMLVKFINLARHDPT